jgi:hypothetical protein
LLWSKSKALSSGARSLIDEIGAVCREREFVIRPRIDTRRANSSIEYR